MKTTLLCGLSFVAGGLLAWGWAALPEPAGGERDSATREEVSRPSREGPLVPELAAALERIEARGSRVEAQLARLRAELRDLRTPVVLGSSGSDPGEVETPVAGPDELAELRALLVELRAALDLHVEENRGPGSAGGLAALRREKPEPDWAALEGLIDEWTLDEECVQAKLRLLTPAEVVAAYGAPSDLWSNEHGSHWVFGRDKDPANGEYRTEVYLRFRDGYVHHAGIALR